MRGDKQIRETAKKLVRLSMEDDRLSAERVGAVLQALEKNPPRRYRQVLRAYLRLVRKVEARSQVSIEHAGPISQEVIDNITQGFSERYGRKLEPVVRENPDLIGGVRARVESDVYDATIANTLNTLARQAR